MPETRRTLSVALGELRSSVDHRFDQVDQRFDATDRRIDERFRGVDEQFVEQRRYTEFAFEAVNNRISSLEHRFERVDRLEEKIDLAVAFPRAQAHVTRNVLVS